MNFLAFFVIISIAILFIIILPLVSGVGNLTISRTPKNVLSNDKNKRPVKFKIKTSKEESEESTESGTSGSYSSSTKFKVDSKTGLKNRVLGEFDKNGINDPNVYDFDIDDLINEDKEEEEQLMKRNLNKYKGKEEHEINEHLV
ncbi:hypothetical protein TBLA_0B06090 [Henningerozyma blattae CBS 6284]|uniref:Uncharacterized protein n=1 Tax=Henningerozyma blattae (strain ATCC 34711 / CBS 6284 / DSM 70876 / NBRC 10599 / NRRL Y-10934 / UCD 77-7) TaxID=1071380 RepID=I2GZ83_HENB6|nr:hypothetical protein TBLA_0B06090 [Tetrapisispora blattae CBS 6284]CCH59435.1 hypothetical protein TBLA_0B06090 [Tetrapisispora blattae CBS 6284]